MQAFRFTVLAAIVLIAGCGQPSSSNPSTSVSQVPALSQFANAPAPLVTPTYDGSGQGMHPDIVQFGTPWHSYKYWMSLTPYPGNNASLENPSILASSDAINWELPPGLVNPIAPLPPSSFHQMDSDMLYDTASDQLWMYYLAGGVDDRTHVYQRKSSDGVTWTTAQEVIVATYNSIISPAVQPMSGGYAMWSVNSAPLGCSAPQTTVEMRTSSDGTTWSAPKTVNLTQPGYQPWHIDVLYVPSRSEYWAIYAAYPKASCGTTNLFFARSPDGINWTTFAKPALTSTQGWDAGQIYRSTMLYDPATDMVRLWYSARDANNHTWHTGYSEATFTGLMKNLN
jgi:hypothetical protein